MDIGKEGWASNTYMDENRFCYKNCFNYDLIWIKYLEMPKRPICMIITKVYTNIYWTSLIYVVSSMIFIETFLNFSRSKLTIIQKTSNWFQFLLQLKMKVFVLSYFTSKSQNVLKCVFPTIPAFTSWFASSLEVLFFFVGRVQATQNVMKVLQIV